MRQTTTVSKERRDHIVLEYLPLVKAIAVRVRQSLPVHVDLDDLIHAGIIGLLDAAAKYDSERQIAFASYAKHRIKGAILDSLRQLDWASRDMRRRQKKVESVKEELTARLGRFPTDYELAEAIGVDVTRWRRMAAEMRNAGPVSPRQTMEDGDAATPDYPANANSRPDRICIERQRAEMLERAMNVLPERYRCVVALYYTKDMSMREIGQVLGVNESRISQMHKSALEKMAVVLQSSGVDSCHSLEC